MDQYCFINYKKYSIIIKDFLKGEVRYRIYRNSLCYPFQCKSKTLFKKESVKNINRKLKMKTINFSECLLHSINEKLNPPSTTSSSSLHIRLTTSNNLHSATYLSAVLVSCCFLTIHSKI